MPLTRALAEALAEMFTPAELIIEVLSRLEERPGGDGLRGAIPSPDATPPSRWFFETLCALNRRGLVSRDGLMAALLAARPGRARELHALSHDLSPPAGDHLPIEEDAGGVELHLSCLSWRLHRPVRWRLDLPVAALLDRLSPDDDLAAPRLVHRQISARIVTRLTHAGCRLDPGLDLAAQGVQAGDTLAVALELRIDAPHQETQTLTLRAPEDDETVERLAEALGFGWALGGEA